MAKAVVFDVDGTLIEQISWMTLNMKLGVPREYDLQLFNQYDRGEITYQEWIDVLVSFIKNSRGPVGQDEIETILRQYTLARNANAVCLQLQRRGYNIGIISAGIDFVVQSVAADIGASPEFCFSNSTFHYDESRNLERVQARGEDGATKLADLEQLCGIWGIDLSECVYVGDGNADKALFEATGLGVTFTYERCRKLHGSCKWQISCIEDLLDIL